VAPKIFNGIDLGKFTDADNLPLRLAETPPLMPDYKNSLNEFNYRLTSAKNVNKGYKREAKKADPAGYESLANIKKRISFKIILLWKYITIHIPLQERHMYQEKNGLIISGNF
jgi:hypothetical protein